MGAARYALPSALAGIASGILAADLGLAPPGVAVLAIAAALCVIGVALVPRGPAVLLLAVAATSFAVGAWRHAPSGADGSTGSVAALAGSGEVEVVGTVVDDPRPRADRLQLVLGDLTIAGDGAEKRPADRLLVWLPRGVDAASGDRMRVRGSIEVAEDFDGFAYREYLARQGIGAITRARSAEPMARASGPGSLLPTIRQALLAGINRLVPEPEAALGAGILLGVRAAIAPEINEAFATSGLTHVVAISGWNIAIVVALVAALARPLDRLPGGRWWTAAVASGVVASYVLLTGASPSVVRAALMAGALLVGRLGGSRAHATSALGLAATVMLIAAPAVLWDVGFQLSLLATAGLIWYAAPIESRLPRWPAWIREPVALTLAAQLTTLPVVLVNFERLSLVAPLANVLVVPLVPLAMLFSAVAAVGGVIAGAVPLDAVHDAAAWLLGGAAWLVLSAMVTVGRLTASVPFAAVDLTVPAPLAVAWLPVLGLATWAASTDGGRPAERAVPDEAMTGALSALARLARPLPAAGVLVLVLVAVTVTARPDGRLHITVLDVGQGDAILVEAPGGATMLVDGGPDPELTLRRLGANLPYHVRSIDLVILSHPHQDHVAGLVEILGRFRVGAVLHAGIGFENAAYDLLLADAAALGISVALARTGQRITLDAGTSVEILYPSAADAAARLPEGDINNGSVVAVLRHGRFAALLTGDAEAPVEAALLARGLVPAVDLLKVGHHGSHSSTTPPFLAAAAPSVAVVSSGEGNEYGHPAPQTLASLAAHPGLATYRTDLDGDVEIVTDGITYRVRTDAGWDEARPARAGGDGGRIVAWPYPTEPPPDACSPSRGCPTASSSTPRAWRASHAPPPGWWRRRPSRSIPTWSRRRRCCTTSTRSRSAARAASTASSAHAGSRPWASRSSPSRSPPTRSAACSTRTATRSAGHRSSSPWPTGTSARSS